MAHAKHHLTGRVFGYLTVTHEADRRTLPSGERVRVWWCVCVCGTTKKIDQKDLIRKNRSTKSCGCMKGKIKTETMGTSGVSQTPIGSQWYSMHKRSKKRLSNGEDCRVLFSNIDEFYDYCTSNGWFDGCVVCRIGDVGHYEPNNIRFDTFQSNIEEAHAHHYKIISPKGVVTEVYNMAKFCRENKLNASAMGYMYRGTGRMCAGWTKYEGAE